jgi:hypothetical protein
MIKLILGVGCIAAGLGVLFLLLALLAGSYNALVVLGVFVALAAITGLVTLGACLLINAHCERL